MRSIGYPGTSASRARYAKGPDRRPLEGTRRRANGTGDHPTARTGREAHFQGICGSLGCKIELVNSFGGEDGIRHTGATDISRVHVRDIHDALANEPVLAHARRERPALDDLVKARHNLTCT